MLIIPANPGTTVRIFLEVLNSDGERVDGYSSPQLDFIINPALEEISGFPTALSLLSTGIYYYDFQVPSGFSNIGSYAASLTWIDPDTFLNRSLLYVIQVSLAFGNVSATPA